MALLSDRLWVVGPEQTELDEYTYTVVDGYTKNPKVISTYVRRAGQVGFPRGDMGKLERVFGGWEDRRVAVPHGHRFQFTGRLRGDQDRITREWIRHGYGQIEAPARFGKTWVLAAILCKLRQRAVFLTHVEDLAHQFEETLRAATNIAELEDEAGRKLLGVPESREVFEIATLSTYQRYGIQNGREWLQDNRDTFGLVLVDEVHRSSADVFAHVVGSLNAAYRCGVTATPVRKSGEHVIVNDVIGPVVTTGGSEQLHVSWSYEYTERRIQPFRTWPVMHNRLCKDAVRNRFIARRVVDDVLDGHHVLVTTERVKHLDDLTAAIHAIDPDITVGVLSGRTKDRDGFRVACKRGEYQVVIAMNRIVELGYNVPRWSSFHNTLPLADPHAWYQRVSRIRTPWEPAFPGDDYVKPDPVCRVYVDTGHPVVYAYGNIVRRKMDELGFTCLNPPAKKKRGRKGFGTQ